jgi:ribonuclease M5
MNEKIKISLPIIVEGRYDKIKLDSIFDATIIETGGFSVFNNKERQLLIKRIGEEGIIVLTDSDGGGKQIRSFLQGMLPKEKIHNLYIPKIQGKERRKDHASKAGLLGVEGIEKDTLIRIFSPFISSEITEKHEKMITKVDFFKDKLTGCDNATKNRAAVCALAGLPDDMTPNALLEALNLLYTYEEYLSLVEEIKTKS